MSFWLNISRYRYSRKRTGRYALIRDSTYVLHYIIIINVAFTHARTYDPKKKKKMYHLTYYIGQGRAHPRILLLLLY